MSDGARPRAVKGNSDVSKALSGTQTVRGSGCATQDPEWRAVDVANGQLIEAGKPTLPEGLSPHALRRSFASWLLAEGEDVPYVQAQMGHTDPSMTLAAYARVVRNGRRSARSKRRELALTGTSGAMSATGSSHDTVS
jgi:integrase